MDTATNGDSRPLERTVVDLFDERAARDPDRVAVKWKDEQLTYGELRNASLHVSRALLAAGAKPRSRVPVLTQMSLEMLPAVIGVLRVGACYIPMDVVAWSRGRIESALSELLSSVALVTSPCPGLELPSYVDHVVEFRTSWLLSPVTEGLDILCKRLYQIRQGFRYDDLAWIVFTSGTTGKPKGVMVYHQGICSVAMVRLNDNLDVVTAEKGLRGLLACPIAFDGCAGVVWLNLTKGGTLVMASPSNFPQASTTCEVLSMTPSMLAVMDPSGDYDRARYIYLGGEAPVMDVVNRWITPTRKVLTTYGPSETTVTISFGELKPGEDPPFGELIPNVEVVLVDENLQECSFGEVMIAGPGLAAGYYKNPELTAQKFTEWNGKRFYRTGDLARRYKDGQIIWAGRADSMIKNRGFLVNLDTEVEPALASFKPVRVAVAFKWGERLVGCIQPANVNIEELRQFMKERYDPFIIPDIIVALDSFPLRPNGKTDRGALKEKLEEGEAEEEEFLALEGETKTASAYDVLRVAFSQVLHVPVQQLNETSAFTKNGGSSLTALKLTNLLNKKGSSVPVVDVLKLDTIGKLQNVLKRSTPSDDKGSDKEPEFGFCDIPVTPVQRLFLNRSLEYPKFCALIGTTRYVGETSKTPTASEIRDACIKVWSAHSIFRARFDLHNSTLSDLGRLNLDWHEVVVEEDSFEAACAAAEERAWSSLESLKPSDTEVPYCDMTCVSVPGRKPLALISRTHHVLADVFSSAILSADDAVLKLPRSLTPPPKQTFDLVRLKAPSSISRAKFNAAAHTLGITNSTLAYAAWALFLTKVTGWNQLGFSMSLSGRTIPWPGAESVVGPLLSRVPFSTPVPSSGHVHEWLAEVHKATLDTLEFDGLSHALPDSIMADPRLNATIVLCFLDVPQSSANWGYSDKQRHNYLLNWSIFQEGHEVTNVLEVLRGYSH
ncbi:nonribosomal peptide synthetase 11 [Fusarium sp. NRRL 25303]|nr:nonribosomal peptide synthetase 11 [Fusarium sp. NRRL 25303]